MFREEYHQLQPNIPSIEYDIEAAVSWCHAFRSKHHKMHVKHAIIHSDEDKPGYGLLEEINNLKAIVWLKKV